MSEPLIQKVTFRPRARLIRTIGDRLISGPVAAIAELVKNGFDADARTATVRFVANDQSVQRIEIQDSGHGMLRETVLEKWMEPATEAKVERRSSPRGRVMLGSKGIGRFAAARLGTRMLLVSSAENGRFIETTIVRIDWSKFDRGQYLDEVQISTRVVRSKTGRTGTLIRVSGVREEWQQRQFEDLLKELRKFVSPLDRARKGANEFSIYLDLTKCSAAVIGHDLWDLSHVEGRPKPIEITPMPIFDAADYSISGVFEANGSFKGKMLFHGVSSDAPKELIFRKALAADTGERSCGRVRVKFLIFDRDPQSIDALIKRANLKNIGKREARRLLDDLCGVGIYRSGFRIRPYGDSDQDWLELDRRRVDDPSNRIGHNQVIGIVEVADEESSDLVERSSREGLEDNGAFDRLKSLLLTLLASQVEPLRRAARVQAGIGVRQPTSYSKIFESAEFKWAFGIADLLPARKRQAAKLRIQRESRRLRIHLDELQTRQAQLEANVTLGRIVAEVVHEGRQPTSVIGAQISNVLEDWPLITSGDPAASDVCAEAEGSLNLVVSEAKRLERLFRLLSPLSGRRRGRPVKVGILQVIEGVLALYHEPIEEAGVQVQVEIGDKLQFNGYRDDLAMSAANLIENSLFWLKETGTKKPSISISSGGDKREFWLDFRDNGPGIDPRLEDQLFEPGFTTRVDGTGLGLSISREALSRSHAEIALQDTRSGCVFRISFARKDHPA